MNSLNLQSLLDERAIEQVLIEYAMALDEHRWMDLENNVFVPETTAHYQGIGDFDSCDAIRGMVSTVIEKCGRTQHLIGNVRIAVDGDQARAKCYLQAIHLGLGDYEDNILTVWGEYRDRLERRPQGWRIVHRELALFKMEGDVGLGA